MPSELILTRDHLHGALFGTVFGGLALGAVWIGVTTARVDRQATGLLALAVCSEKGWVTVRFPGGGEFTCTPTEQRPLDATPPVRRMTRTKKIVVVEPPADTIQLPP